MLVPGEEWQLVSEGYRATDGPAVSASGEMFFTDPPNNRIHKVGLDGKVSVFAENTNGANGMMFGPDGRLYTGRDAHAGRSSPTTSPPRQRAAGARRGHAGRTTSP